MAPLFVQADGEEWPTDPRMSEFKFTLNGFTAIVAAVVVLTVGGIRYVCLWEALKPEQLGVLRKHLAQEDAQRLAPALRAAMDAGNHQAAEQLASKSLDPADIKLGDVSARGSASDLIVRVSVRHRAADAASGAEVRYFRMSHSVLTGWKVLPRQPKWWQYWLRMI